MKQLYSKHFGRAVVYTLLALFLCVAGVGKAAADVEFTYTNTGTEVTLRLWMYNFAEPSIFDISSLTFFSARLSSEFIFSIILSYTESIAPFISA